MLPNIHIIYASASGNVEAVVQKVGTILADNRITAFIHRAEECDIEVLKQNNYFVFATSTWEHGVINPYFDRFLSEMNGIDLKGKYSGFVGLGDTRYEPVHFCKGIEILKDQFLTLGGQQMGTTLKINGNPYSILDSVVADWSSQLILQIKRYVR